MMFIMKKPLIMSFVASIFVIILLIIKIISIAKFRRSLNGTPSKVNR
jgi:hypothetical protein